MRHRHTLVPLFALALAAAACDNAAAPRPYDATGAWTGTVNGVAVHLSLAQTGEQVSGSGKVVSSRDVPVTAAGTAQQTTVNLTLRAQGFEDMVMMGAFTGHNAITAYVAGSGFYGDEIQLHRD
jgi:hypothetical protein